MRAYLALARADGAVAMEDRAALARGLAAVGVVAAPAGDRAGEAWCAMGVPDPLLGSLPRAGSGTSGIGSREAGYEFTSENLSIIGSDATAMLATGLVPRALDAEGLAALLWRGAAVAARLPVRGLRETPAGRGSLPPGASPPQGLPVPPVPEAVRTTPVDPVHVLLREAAAGARGAAVLLSGRLGSAALALATRASAVVVRWPVGDTGQAGAVSSWARGRGLDATVLDGATGDPAALLDEYLRGLDLPSADGFERHLLYRACAASGARSALDATGAAALFGHGEAFARMAAPAGERRRRGPRGPAGDPLDLDAQRAHEVAALARVPLHRVHSLEAFLPAAAREALTRLPARPPDGVVPPAPHGPAAASWLATAATRDRGGRDVGAASRRAGVEAFGPFLEESLARTVRGLRDAERFGSPGSGGGLLRATEGSRPPAEAVRFDPTLDAWLRAPLSAWLDATLAPERLAAQGCWRPEAVAEAVRRFRARAKGWTARHVFLLAQVVHWIDREGLSEAAP